MPRQYKNTGGNQTIQRTIDNNLNGNGPPIYLPGQDGFEEVNMGSQLGGAIADVQFPGVNTSSRSDCVVIAALQGDPGAWTRYYFTHLQGGIWEPANQDLFNEAINNPAIAWMVMNSNTWIGLETLFDDINKGNPNGLIPANNMLMYVSKNDTFGLRLTNGGIGQITV